MGRNGDGDKVMSVRSMLPSLPVGSATVVWRVFVGAGHAKCVYMKNPKGVTDAEMAKLLGVSRASPFRYRRLLNPEKARSSHHTMRPTH
jgi:hypothetical protein